MPDDDQRRPSEREGEAFPERDQGFGENCQSRQENRDAERLGK